MRNASIDWTTRSNQSEWMDTERVAFEDFQRCLSDLAHVNRWTLAYRPTLAFLERVLVRRRAREPLHIVDVGCGYGDMLREIAAWAERRRVRVELTGIDLNPWSARAAREATPRGPSIEWLTADAFAYAPGRSVDVVVSSLFTHHLPDALVARFLRFMEHTARAGWFINDLHRHPVPYYFFRSFAKLAGYHRFVQHDGPISIARAFIAEDWRRLVRDSGISAGEVDVRWCVPFRLTVARLKP